MTTLIHVGIVIIFVTTIILVLSIAAKVIIEIWRGLSP